MALLMIIDEDIDSCMLLKRLLTRQGHQVKTFTNDKEAFAWLKRQRPDLVIVSAGRQGEKAEDLVSLLLLKGLEGERIVINANQRSFAAVRKSFSGAVREIFVKSAELDKLETLVNTCFPVQ